MLHSATVRQNAAQCDIEFYRTVQRFVRRFVAMSHYVAFCRTVVGEVATVRDVHYRTEMRICIYHLFSFDNSHVGFNQMCWAPRK